MKTDQEMVRWALEESSEPVIKNPYLRSMFAGGQLVQPGPGRQGYQGKTSGTGTGAKAIEDPKVIKQAEDILKKLVEKKHGHKVLDWSEKATHSKLKDLPVKARSNLNDIINKIADKNGWLNGTQYKNTMVVETFMDDYARNGYFTGHEKTSTLLNEFRETDPDSKFREINKVFKKWKDGNIVVEGYDINNLEKGTLEALDDWSPTMASERSINKTNELKYLDGINNQKLTLNQAQAKFRRKFPNAAKNAFWYRVDQLYQLKVEGKIPSGLNTFKTHDVVKGERSDWLKKGLTHNKAGNYNKLLLAADELDVAGKTKQATRLRNSAIKYFSPNKGILAKVPGEAEHPWFRTHGGTSGQLKIDSLVRGDLNTFKNLNFEAPIEKLRKEYAGASSARKAEIQKLIQNRQMFMDELTGGMTKNVKFNFTPNEVKIINLTKPIDTLAMRELGQLKTRGAAFEKSILSKGKDLDLLTKQGTLIKKQITDKNIAKILKSFQNVGIGPNCKIGGNAEGGRIGFSKGGYDQCMNNAIQEHNKNLKSDDLSIRNSARAKQFNINKTKNMKSLLGAGVKGGKSLLKLGRSWGIELEPIFEGAFYEWGRRKGYTHDQAKEETFFWKMLDPSTKTGLLEGADPLLEKELYQLKSTEKENLGKVIGERKTVKRYIDNEKALYEAQGKYNQLYNDYQVATSGKERNPEKAAQLLKASENAWEEMNRLEDQMDLDKDMYQAAVEKQQTEQGERAIKYGEYGQGDTELLAKQREKRRQREMEDKFPGYGKADIDKRLEGWGYYIDPNLRSYKGQTVQRPKGLKFLPKTSHDDMSDYIKDQDKMNYFAENFRLEKADGGIVSLLKK